MTTAKLKSMEKLLQEEVEKLRSLQKETQKYVSGRTQLDGQRNENLSVKEEMDLLDDDAVVYKMMGPVLVKQEVAEAKQIVSKRLEYIASEIERYDKLISDKEKQQKSSKDKLTQLQVEYQQLLNKSGAVR